MIPPKTYNIQFLKRQDLAKDTHSFFFKRPVDFEFIAGLYNRWTLPIEATDGRGNSRLFTISSSPLEKEYVSFPTKIVQSQFKKALLELKEGAQIQMFGPLGRFTLDENDNRTCVLLAGGIGITPFHSIIPYANAQKLTIPLILIASFSTPEEMVFYDELTQIAKENQNIKVIYTITRPQESQQQWTGETGRISDTMIKKYVSNVMDAIYYVVGPPAMLEGMKKVLLDMEIKEENIKVEQFTGY